MKTMKTKNFSTFFEKKSIVMFLFGFSSGLPILLVFSTLSVWLIKAGIERSTVTLFSWVGFAYAFKYIWAPIIDSYKISIFKNFGHRKSWLLISQMMIVLALICVANSNPLENITFTAIAIIFVAFASATQDITIDAFRIESAPQKYQGILSSMYIAGYRIAMIVSGAGSLLLASYLGTEIYSLKVWQTVYLYMACFMSIGILTTIFSTEPKIKKFYFNSLKNKLNFFVVSIISLVAFAYLYSALDNPFSSKEVFNKFLFSH